MADVKKILNDPDYKALPYEEKLKVWSAIDKDFAGLEESEQRKVIERTSMPQVPTAAETPMGRFTTGITESVIGAAEGLIGLPRLAKEAVTHPIDTAKAVAGGLISYPKERYEAIKEDPWAGSGRLTGDIGIMGAGRLARVGGVKLGAKGAPVTPGPIPSAAPFALEGKSGLLPTVARMLAVSPIGSRPLAKATKARNVAMTSEAQRLLGGPTQAAKITGEEAVTALKRGFRAYTKAESELWNPLKKATTDLEISVPLSTSAKTGAPLFATAKEAHDVLTANISPSTQRVLLQLNKQAELLESGGIAAQLPAASMGVPTTSLISALPAEMRAQVMDLLGEGTPANPSWTAVHQARTEVGRLLSDARKKSPTAQNLDTHTLGKIYDALTDDLHGALTEYPELQIAFDEAAKFTKAKKQLYGTKGTLTRQYMASEPSVMPSQAIPKLMAGTPESANNFMKALGDNPTAKQSVARGVISDIFNKATGNRFGAQEALIDGPAFATQFRKYRPIVKELVPEDMLKRWDTFADEVGKYSMTKGSAGTMEGIGGRIASLAEIGALSGAAGAVTVGNLPLAASLGAPLLVGRTLVNVMLQPTGPGLFARYLQTGKWSPELGRLVEAGAYGSVLLPKHVVESNLQGGTE